MQTTTPSNDAPTLTLPEGSVGWHTVDFTVAGITEYHMFPLDDLKPHACINCWCKPTNDDEDDMWLHKAMDNREWHFDRPFH